MKKFFAAIVLCLVCTVCFGQSILCPTDSTHIILPGYVHANDTMTVFDLVPNATNTVEIYKGDALYNSFSTSSCVYEFNIQDAGEYLVVVKNPYVTHNQKIIVLPLEVQTENDSITVQNSTQK